MDYIQVLKDLISIDTTVPPGKNYGKVVNYLAPLFNQTGFQTQIIDIPADQAEGREGRVNLICHRREPGKPRLIFYAHIDVVPAHGWEAFKPVSGKGENLWQRSGRYEGSDSGFTGSSGKVPNPASEV